MLHFLLFLLLHVSTAFSATSTSTSPPDPNLPSIPADAVSLLTFKSKADPDNRLLFTLHERFDYCSWQGVKCVQFRVTRFFSPSAGLSGTIPPGSLTRLDQLRVLILRNNSLSGPIPDLSPLKYLKSLIIDRNHFSGSFPPSIISINTLRVLDLAFNNFTGPIPLIINQLDRLRLLKLEYNYFTGPLPALNQSELKAFNVSGNNLTGIIPVTPTLSRFRVSSFAFNPNLCGKVVNKGCDDYKSPFFDPNSSVANNSPPGTETSHPPTTSIQSSSQSALLSPHSSNNRHKRNALIIGLSFVGLLLLASLFVFFFSRRRSRRYYHNQPDQWADKTTVSDKELVTSNELSVVSSAETMTVGLDNGNTSKEHTLGSGEVKKDGSLRFSVGETKLYTLEQLMRASAELLGRGLVGATYKAKLDNQLIVTVKRLDGTKTGGLNGQMFEKHMEAVGALRHPNLVPVRASFQTKGERLIIFDYHPNGSVFNLIHGSRSTGAKPLHWTSCLKIAEDVTQGLAYIHQTSKLVHGNIKSTNVLLGSDFEACVTDYCLITILDSAVDDNPDSLCYRAPEIRKSNRRATPKADVYAFGVLLLELVSGKPPSQHPYLSPPDMPDWVRATRDDDSGADDRLDVLIDVASACSSTSPEQRPAMWQVLKMIQKIKSSVMADNLLDATTITRF